MTPEELQRLLASFADPATVFDVRDLGTQLAFHLIRGGKPLTGDVDKTTRKVTVGGADTIELRSFFASARLANLVALAQTQSRVFDVSHLISRSILLDGHRVEGGLGALGAIRPEPRSTRVVIASAPAGMGKTKLAEALVKKRADDFLARKEQRIALLVSSRGRRLSLLNDVIAAMLGDLRAPITHHEVPPLVSMGLIDLIIDGFDELVNADGYRDAWESVGHLFDQIGHGGVVILSARDAFFSEQDFVARAQKEARAFSLSLQISFMELLPLDDKDIHRMSDSRLVLHSLREPLFEMCQLLPPGLRGRPFFIERLASRVAEDGAIQFGSPLRLLDHDDVGVPAGWCDRVLLLASEAGAASILGQNAYGLAFALVRRLRPSERVSFNDIAVGNVSLIEPRLETITFRRCTWHLLT